MQQANLRGILLMITAMAFFAVEDMFIKFAATELPTGQIIAISGLFGVPIFAALARMGGKSVFVSGAYHPAVLIRGAGETVGSLAYVAALGSIPMPTVSAVLQAMPLVVTLGSVLFLGEKVGWRRWAAIATGLIGVMLIIRPGLDGFQPAALWVLTTVVGLAVRDLATRYIPPEYSDAQISSWGLVPLIFLGSAMIGVSGGVVVPDGVQTLQLVGMVLFGVVGYWAITAASRGGEVSVVAPFRYTRLIFAILIAWVVFGEPADVITLSGAALIIGSGLYSFARERARKRALSMPAAAG
jgi:drug/metabolite transporter (DMT)-like permease